MERIIQSISIRFYGNNWQNNVSNLFIKFLYLFCEGFRCSIGKKMILIETSKTFGFCCALINTKYRGFSKVFWDFIMNAETKGFHDFKWAYILFEFG